MVEWPKACIGCSDTDEQRIELHEFTHKEQDVWDAGTAVYVGEERSLGAITFLCGECASEAKTRFAILFSLGLILFIGGLLLMFSPMVTMPFDDPAVIPIVAIGMIVMLIGIPIGMSWFYRYKLARQYVTIRLAGKTPVFRFKNPEFERMFREANPSALIKPWKWYQYLLNP